MPIGMSVYRQVKAGGATDALAKLREEWASAVITYVRRVGDTPVGGRGIAEDVAFPSRTVGKTGTVEFREGGDPSTGA
ncbi:hypothetical protein ACGFJT_12445 [Actinomadura geliboluensis]|uniref:hypothetical protein n=1 Tax=Actinomadura geliboluensis TaxID=882440 RepID=UPI003723128F